MLKSSSPDFTLTLACNNNCLFCPRRALEPILTSPRRAVAAVRRAGGCDSVTLTGGEPTLLPSLAATARSCLAAGAKKAGLVTNGRALADPARLEELLQAGISSFIISVYSHLPRVHDRLARAPGSCAQTWRGLARALAAAKAGKASVSVNMVLCSANIGTAQRTLRLLKAAGAASVTLLNLAGPGVGRHLFSYSRLRRLAAAVAADPAAFPARLMFRGFPLCALPPGAAAESQNIEGAGGVAAAKKRGYELAFRAAFIKPAALCAGCGRAQACNGLPRAYFKRFATRGLK